MIVESTNKCLGPLEVPDDCRIVRTPTPGYENDCIEVFSKRKDGSEFLLVKEFKYDNGKRAKRVWLDSKGNTHRSEKNGPAIIDDYFVQYSKHGKRHRTDGPAFINNDGCKVYCLDGIELTKSVWEECVRLKSGHVPPAPKVDKKLLADYASKLSEEARKSRMIDHVVIPPNEIYELDAAVVPKNWKMHGSIETNKDLTRVVCLNCEPLDDTLRCYIAVDNSGNILTGRLQIE